MGDVFANSSSLAASAGGKRPNILFFLGEGMRADEMSAAGNPIIETPHFDRTREPTLQCAQLTRDRAACAIDLASALAYERGALRR